MTPLRPTPEQGRAADPAASVWVTANAGTGKTRVLVDRVLRLLLAGAEPATILCITFTRAAAAEMRGRVETRLAEWATARDAAALAGDLEALQGIVPDPGTLDRAARLFAQVLDLPGGLAIMTIHALSNLLLKRFPLEADVPPHFEVMDDRSATELLTDAREEVMAKLADDDESELAGAMNLLARELADLSLAEALDEAVSARLRLRDLMQDDETVAPMVRRIRHTLGIATDAREADLVGQACQESAFDRAGLAGAVTALRTGGKTDAKRAEQIKLWLSLDLPQRERGVEAYSRAFLTEAASPRSR